MYEISIKKLHIIVNIKQINQNKLVLVYHFLAIAIAPLKHFSLELLDVLTSSLKTKTKFKCTALYLEKST